MPVSTGSTPQEKPKNQWAEPAAVWSLIAAVLLCPWVSGPALSDYGRFLPRTRALLWLVSAASLLAGTFCFFVFLESEKRRGLGSADVLRRFGTHTLLTVAVLAASLGAADFLLARLSPLPAAAHLDVPKAQIYGWAFAPNQPIVIINPDTGEVYREKVNSRGWRDVEHPSEKSRPRLLLVGDSQVFGVGVPLEKTIGRQLQRLLDDRCEVVSAGLSGWGTDQELLFLENEGWTYRPDVVVVLFTATNDVMNNMYDRAFFGTARKPVFTLSGDRLVLHPLPRSKPSALRRFFGHSSICRHIRLWLATRRINRDALKIRYARIAGESPLLPADNLLPEDMENDYSHMSVFGEKWSSRLSEGWRLTLRLIEEMDRQARAHGAVFVLYPWGQPPPKPPPVEWENRGKTYRLDLEKPFRLLRRFCRSKGILYLEEPMEFRAAMLSGRLQFKTDRHLNAEGSRRVAEIIARFVVEKGLVGKTAENQWDER